MPNPTPRERAQALDPYKIVSECSQRHVQSVIEQLRDDVLALTDTDTLAARSVGAAFAAVFPGKLPATTDSVKLPPPRRFGGTYESAPFNYYTSDDLRAAILADREKQAAQVPEGYALVSIEQLTAWKNRANTLATLSLKAERYEVGRELKTEIADVIAVPVPPGLAAPTTEPSKAEQEEAPSVIDWSDKDRADYWQGRAIVSERKLATHPPASNAGERGAFEAAYRRVFGKRWTIPQRQDMFNRSGDGYTALSVNDLWLIWQARAALATKPQAGDVAQDSARLDWLESVGMANIQRMRRFDPKAPKYWDIEFGNDEDTATGPNLRAAIDAARTRGEGGGA